MGAGCVNPDFYEEAGLLTLNGAGKRISGAQGTPGMHLGAFVLNNNTAGATAASMAC